MPTADEALIAELSGHPLDTGEIQPVSRQIASFARSRPDSLALAMGETRWSYSELEQRVRGCIAAFSGMGLKPGDVVAFVANNHPRFFAIMLAAMRTGIIILPVNVRLKQREIAYVLSDSQAKIVIADDQFRQDVAGAVDEGIQIVPTNHVDSWVKAEEPADKESGAWDAPSLLLYTSGTTGRPKGVLTTERSLSIARAQEKALSGFSGWSMEEILLSPLPLFHIGGISWAVCGLDRGCSVVLTTDMSPSGLLDSCLAWHVTRVFMVPQLVRGLIEEMLKRNIRVPSLAAIHYGAAAMDPPLLKRGIENIGCDFLQYFGMTEMCGTITILEPGDHDLERPERLASVGKALPGVTLQIRDSDGRILGRNDAGEIWVKSETCMLGYLNMEGATKEALVDGFYRTGDGGRMDEAGFIYLTDRIKDMINSGGENVYPVEVEAVLREHPAVADCAVYGVPDETWGEMVCAAIELRPDVVVEPKSVIDFVRHQIAGYKCPKRLHVVDALPRTASGKVQRAKVRQSAMEAG